MKLQPLTLSLDPTFRRSSSTREDLQEAAGNRLCAFCGMISGRWGIEVGIPSAIEPDTNHVACPLCALPQHLERLRIEEEAALVWLPEISQAALNTIMREIHIALHALGEDVGADAVFRRRVTELEALYHARAILFERMAVAISRVGTTSPHELGLALLELSSPATARRTELLGGVRLLPLGRFYQGEHDVYPEIVADWRNRGDNPPVRSKVAA